MERRQVLAGLGALTLPLGSSVVASADPGPYSEFEVVSEVDLSATEGPIVAYAPLFEARSRWQLAAPARIVTQGRARIVRDQRYGAPMVRVAFGPEPGPRRLRLVQRVRTRARGLDPHRLTPRQKAFWTAPLPSLPDRGIVADTAAGIVAGRTLPRERARAIYEWVVTNTFRDAAVRGCGLGGVENMLKTGYLGGKCADINGLTVALCRAAGLPARDVYGVRLGPSQEAACLGVPGPDVTRAQHCRAEVHLEGEGWLPLDPADVRKIVLETRASLESPEVVQARARLFGSWEGNWAAYNSATDLILPGAPRPPAERFLMYPTALSASAERDQLDPDSFRYRITSRRI